MSKKNIPEEKNRKVHFFNVDIFNVQVICRHMCHITPPLLSPPWPQKTSSSPFPSMTLIEPAYVVAATISTSYVASSLWKACTTCVHTTTAFEGGSGKART